MIRKALMIEVEVTQAGGSLGILRLTDTPFRPFSAADPDRPNGAALPLLVEVTPIISEVYSDLSSLSRSYGSTEIVISMTGGDLAAYASATWGAITIYWGDIGPQSTPAAFAAWRPILHGRIGAVRPDISVTGPSRLRLTCYDLRGDLDDTIQTRVYAGTNIGPAGYEGTSDDLMGKPLPLALGDLSRANVSPPLVNVARRVYQLTDGGDFTAEDLRSGGGSTGATMAGDLSSAAFDVASPASGTYVRDRARGLVAVGGGVVAAAFTACFKAAFGGTYVETAPQLIARLLARRFGAPTLGPGFVDASLAPAPVGLWLETGASYADAIQVLARSFGGWCVPDSAGVWQIGRLAAPAGLPAETLGPYQIRDLAVDDREGQQPAWRITVRYGRNYTLMRRADLAGAVAGTDQGAALARDWREAVWSSPAVKSAYPGARDLIVETALVYAADAEALAADLGVLFGQTRQSLAVTVEMTPERLAYQRGVTCVAIDYPALGPSGLYRVMGRRLLDPAQHLMTLTLWG